MYQRIHSKRRFSSGAGKFLLLCIVLLTYTFVAAAQTGTAGTIVGTVTDPTGAVVPNVKIIVTNTDTGQTRDVTSNASGQYVVPDLQVGHYKARAEISGFKAVEQTDIALNVGDRSRVDFKLEVGNTQQSVTVEATAVAVQSESGEVSSVITGQQVTQLATNGRSLYSLATLTPGASSNMSDLNIPTSAGGDSNVSFNGMRQNHNLWVVDGGEASDRGGAGGMDVMPSVDAIAEFRTLTSNYSADFGLSSAATMTMVVKSGTRDFHASVWEFNRNDALDAANAINKANGVKTPELRLNTYGFNVGGPVYIPKVYNRDKDRTFFFYNMEWRKLIQGGNVNTTVPLTSEYGGQFPSNVTLKVPTAAQLGPNLLAKLTAAGLTPGGTFPNSKIPTSLLDPNAQALLAAGIFPGPNGSGSQFLGGNKLPTNVREEIIRIDHRFSDKFFIFGHFIHEAVDQTYGTSQWSGDNVPTIGNLFTNPAYHAVIHATYSITPSILNEIAYNQNGNTLDLTPKGTYQRPSNLNIPELFPGNNLNRIPSVKLESLGTNYDVGSWPWHNKADDYQIRDDVSWIHGAHQFKFGVSWALCKKVQDLFGPTQGSFNFNGAYTGNDFADFLLGYANTYQELAVQDKGYWNNISPAAYVQDNWKVTPRLTLNLGLRWDGIPHTYEANNRMANFYPGLYNPANKALLAQDGNSILPTSPGLGPSPNPILADYQFYLNGIGIPGQNGIPKGLVKDSWLNFGPRVGFAYDLTGGGKTVLRGGFGIMYERIQGNDMYNAGPNQPFSASITNNNVLLSDPRVSLQSGTVPSSHPISVGSITGLAYTDYRSPASYQYSIGVQHQIAPDTVVTAAYVGNQNRHQNDYRETNLPNPSFLPGLIDKSISYNNVVPYSGFNSIKVSENALNSHYNALQIDVRSTIHKNLTLFAAYTLSRSIDSFPAGSGGTGGLGGDLATISNPYDRSYDRGPYSGDRTHIGVVSFVYELPFFHNSQSRAIKTLLGGWQTSGIVSMMSGLPLGITLGGSAGSNGLPNSTNRPNINGSVNYPETSSQWFSAAFSTPTPGAWGNLPANSIRGPGRQNWNLSVFKRFVFSETRGSAFELRVETFNTWNHTQYQGIGTSFANQSQFGHVTSVWDPRVFQLGAKLYF